MQLRMKITTDTEVNITDPDLIDRIVGLLKEDPRPVNLFPDAVVNLCVRLEDEARASCSVDEAPETMVAGFAFNERRDVVVLVEKNHPRWQKGKFNAVGGHVEPGETPVEAMRREFREETGVDHDGWQETVTLVRPGAWRVHFFRAFTDDVMRAHQTTDEPIHLLTVHDARNHSLVVDNLRWLIPMQLDEGLSWPVTVTEVDE